jgi:uncharacterized alpha-E superfamily protein
MLSRVADAVFWMARYMERSDNIIRALRTNYIASQDEIQDFNWQMWMDWLSSPSNPYDHPPTYREALQHILIRKENDTSVLINIIRARENARSVQDYITKEVWQCINSYYHTIRSTQTENQILFGDPVTAMDMLLNESTLFYGTVDMTMSRGEGYTFLNIGKYIERLLRNLDILELKIQELEQGGNEAIQWKYLLYSLSGYEFHSKHYKNALTTASVIDQVIMNTLFPHSILYCLLQAERYSLRLEDISLPEQYRELNFMLGKAINNLRYGMHPLQDIEQIKTFIAHVRVEIKNLSQKLATIYFGYSN